MLLVTVGAFGADSRTPCQLQSFAQELDGKEVTVRAGLRVGFEDSSFVSDCGAEWLNIWVTFGGDVDTPTVYCCGDHDRPTGSTPTVENVRLPLRKDDSFKEFMRLLDAQLPLAPTGVPCFYDCYLYRVTATFKGHFFRGSRTVLPDGRVHYMGYGHLGCCSLFVIQEVSDIESTPTDIPRDKTYDCDSKKTDLPVDKEAVIAWQKAGDPGENPDGTFRRLIAPSMLANHEDFEQGDTTTDYKGELQQEKHATVIWLAKSKLTSYKAEFERFAWLAQYANDVDDRVWTPISLERVACNVVKR